VNAVNSSSTRTDALTLLACQISVPETDTVERRAAHLARSAQVVDVQLQQGKVDLVVLPELSSLDYSRSAFDRLQTMAEEIDGPSFETWAAVAHRHRTTIVYGIPRRTGTGYRISQVAVGPDGKLIGCFDKIHIAQYGLSMEKEYFERADRLFVFTINGVRIAPIICYDIRIPELTRTLCVDHNADLILHCGAYARDPSFYSWHPFVTTRALENQVYVLSLNRAGSDFGSSLFCPPWVDETIQETGFGDSEEFRRFEIDTGLIDTARGTYPFLLDRLPDYTALNNN